MLPKPKRQKYKMVEEEKCGGNKVESDFILTAPTALKRVTRALN